MELKEIEKIIGEAIGEGSMCWSKIPVGIFDSENASRIVDETVKKIINIELTPVKTLDEWFANQPLIYKLDLYNSMSGIITKHL